LTPEEDSAETCREKALKAWKLQRSTDCGRTNEEGHVVSALPVGTRVLALIVLLLGGIVGLAMAVAGNGEAFGIHGWIVLLFCAVVAWRVMLQLDAPEPPLARLRSYYDDPIKVGIILAMIWAVIGMVFGLWVAYLLAWPDLTFDAPWASFGRLRPAHTTGIIFGFGGSALIATSFHVMQRTSRARLAGSSAPGSC
jgi:cytochrome c oxidase cbb3-type subunit 1